MYQGVCCSNITSDIIKDMKVDPKNKWRKVVSLSLNTSSTQAWSIENYDFKFFKSEFRPTMTWMIRVFLLITLVIYKAYFKSHYIWRQRLRTYILYEKLMRLCALRFCNQVLPDFHHLWSEKLCSQQYLFKLLELVTYWDPCKARVSIPYRRLYRFGQRYDIF